MTSDLEERYAQILRNGTYNNRTLEGSPLICDTTQEFHIGVSMIALVFGLTIMIGNTLVLIVLFKYPAKKFVPLNWLLCHLALADFIMGVTVFWWYGVAEIRQIPVTSHAKPISYGVGIAAIIASLAGLMMISLDRYLLLFYNVKYSKIISRRRLVAVLILMWLIPIIILVIIPSAGWSCVHQCDCRIHNIAPDDVYCFHERCSQMFPPLTKLQMLITSIYFLILFLITIVLYAIMFYRVWDKLKGLQHIRSTTSSGRSTSSQHKSSSADGMSSTQEHKGDDESAMSCTDDKLTTNPSVTADDRPAVVATGPDHPSSSTPTDDAADHYNTFSDDSSPPTVHRPAWRHDNESPVFVSAPCKEIAPIEYVRTPKQSTVHKHHVAPTMMTSSVADVIGKKDAKKEAVMTSSGRRRRRRRSSKGMKTRRREIELMKSMFIVIAVFIVTSLPSILFLFYTYFHNDREIKEIGNILLQITTINSLLNPLLYFWRIKSMRRNLFKLLRIEELRKKRKAFMSKLHPPVPTIPPPTMGDSPQGVVAEQNNGGTSSL